MKTFCAIFTSPTPTESFDTKTDEGLVRKKQKTDGQKKATKNNVATLLSMDGKVTPRSIAYTAVIVGMLLVLHFHLPDFYNSWFLILLMQLSGLNFSTMLISAPSMTSLLITLRTHQAQLQSNEPMTF